MLTQEFQEIMTKKVKSSHELHLCIHYLSVNDTEHDAATDKVGATGDQWKPWKPEASTWVNAMALTSWWKLGQNERCWPHVLAFSVSNRTVIESIECFQRESNVWNFIFSKHIISTKAKLFDLN